MMNRDPGVKLLRNRLKLRHVELFNCVCELQTLRKAAAACSMTQPAATKLIQDLEEMFGVALFQRGKRGMVLTDHGAVVRQHMTILMADVSNMRDALDLYSSGATGHIRLGIIPSLSAQLLSESVTRTLEARPNVRFTWKEEATTELLARLVSNDLDLVFGRVLDVPQAGNLRVQRIYTETFALVCGATHPFAKRRNLEWTEMALARWVLPATGTPMRAMADDLFLRQHVLQPAVAVESSSFHQMRVLIARGDFLGVLPRSVALQGKTAKDLVLLKPTAQMDFAPISLIARKEIEPSPLIQFFVQNVLDSAKALALEA